MKKKNIMKRKFKIIEDGKFSESQLSRIEGGMLYCSGSKKYIVTTCEGSHSICPNVYFSCNGDGLAQKLACENYKGPTGPGGSGHFDEDLYMRGDSINTVTE